MVGLRFWPHGGFLRVQVCGGVRRVLPLLLHWKSPQSASQTEKRGEYKNDVKFTLCCFAVSYKWWEIGKLQGAATSNFTKAPQRFIWKLSKQEAAEDHEAKRLVLKPKLNVHKSQKLISNVKGQQSLKSWQHKLNADVCKEQCFKLKLTRQKKSKKNRWSTDSTSL